MTTLQTLDRGIRALEIVSQRPGGISIADLAAELDVARAIGYRIVATLEAHSLVARMSDGRIRLAAGTAVLGSRFRTRLREVAQPLLRELARQTSATAFLSTLEDDECVVIAVAEPETGMLRVGYRIGTRHPVSLGAAGIAILAGRPESEHDTDAIRQARRDGFSVTSGEIEHGAVGVAASVRTPSDHDGIGLESSVGVVAIEGLDTDSAAAEVVKAAAHIRALLST
ncbi:IclR family transcriptional regulator [Rhodococcus chondri]|uniref:Helix-turn-helix domain-containing protein n=1 Tax=Rhodococcus chondri TaxID=3065941 RepID=A0ABU7JLP4_9NOCA|nr:helix-turn-helix domain-containing protein [Rhodococcus sp. CC-R104]MEE2030947.1 helix-turn-helix domain-containing protein [Rhodococcus sp. CC-R104]